MSDAVNTLVNNETLIGKFVSDQRHGLSKVVGVEGGNHRVEYFISPWKRKTVVVNLAGAKPFRLLLQTRVYVELSGSWKVGRIVLVHDQDSSNFAHSYEVRFPNDEVRQFSEEALFSRCLLAPDDPTVALGMVATETQYWHEHRQRIVSSLLKQRAACRGLSAVLSSKVEFVPHQLNVARRVLEDPLQRYLLADEVGMGKTIEAGFIIRQFLLSEARGQVWVVTPASLARQWAKELEQKFSISEFPERVCICTVDDLSSIPLDSLELLVIDEAHHLVSDGISPELQRIALASQRLLLLSATPSLGRTDVLLRLLTLIDPTCYSEIAPEVFASKVERREEYGIFLRGLRDDASPAVLRQRLRRIPDLFGDDLEVHRLGELISNALTQADSEGLRSSIRSLRTYVADVHRIHQRLIRTRRRDAADWVFRPRGPAVQDDVVQTAHLRMSWIDDSRLAALFDLFEQWRIEMSAIHPKSSPMRAEFLHWTVAMFEALGSGVEKFREVISLVPIEILGQGWHEDYAGVFRRENCEPARATQVAIDVQRHLASLERTCSPRLTRVVIFGSDIADLNACADALETLMGRAKIMRAWDLDQTDDDLASLFESDKNVRALFCSRNEEEGLNLHFVDALIHLDLPFSPARLEQRIGRLDRFGRKLDHLEQRLFFPALDENSSLWEAWFDLLSNSFHLFNESVADVQFTLETLVADLSEALFDGGAAGLRNEIANVRTSVYSERERLDNQFALDRVLLEEGSADGFVEELDDLEADEDEIASAARGWLVDSLQFKMHGDLAKSFGLDWDSNRTLLPVSPWARVFQAGLQGDLTFSRNFALRAHGDHRLQLMRLGSHLMRPLQREVSWDDRGTAFATWRHLPNWAGYEHMAFKLCFVVEARLPEGLTSEEKNSLRARLDGYLAPSAEVLYINADLGPVEDVEMLEVLERPYARAGRASEYADYNLGSRQDVLFGLIDASKFDTLCHRIRSASESWLRGRDRFVDMVKAATERGTLDIDQRNRRLLKRQGLLRVSGDVEDSGLQREIDLNSKLLETLSNPVVRLDAIGAIVLSSQSPQAFMGESS